MDTQKRWLDRHIASRQYANDLSEELLAGLADIGSRTGQVDNGTPRFIHGGKVIEAALQHV